MCNISYHHQIFLNIWAKCSSEFDFSIPIVIKKVFILAITFFIFVVSWWFFAPHLGVLLLIFLQFNVLHPNMNTPCIAFWKLLLHFCYKNTNILIILFFFFFFYRFFGDLFETSWQWNRTENETLDVSKKLQSKIFAQKRPHETFEIRMRRAQTI